MAEAHAINEELFRQVLREHYLTGMVVDGVSDGERWMMPGRCKCHRFATDDYQEDAALSIEAWIDHVMRIAAVTPLIIADDPAAPRLVPLR